MTSSGYPPEHLLGTRALGSRVRGGPGQYGMVYDSAWKRPLPETSDEPALREWEGLAFNFIGLFHWWMGNPVVRRTTAKPRQRRRDALPPTRRTVVGSAGKE